MNGLALETLEIIANYLRGDQGALLQLSLVSRRWHNRVTPYLYSAPQFNRRNSFELFSNNLTAANGNFIRELRLHRVSSRRRQDLNRMLGQVIPRAPQLEILNLDLYVYLSNAMMLLVARTLPNLEVLSVDQCLQIDDHSIIEVLQRCPRLRELRLGSSSISDWTLMTVLTHAPQLTHLRLTNCRAITQRGVRAIMTEESNLEHLEIIHCNRVRGNFNDVAHNLRVFEYVRRVFGPV